jgi:hypothetical protein
MSCRSSATIFMQLRTKKISVWKSPDAENGGADAAAGISACFFGGTRQTETEGSTYG